MRRALMSLVAVTALAAIGCQSRDDGRSDTALRPNRSVQGLDASTNSPGSVSTNTNRSTTTTTTRRVEPAR